MFKYGCRVYNAITASLAALDGGIVAGKPYIFRILCGRPCSVHESHFDILMNL